MDKNYRSLNQDSLVLEIVSMYKQEIKVTHKRSTQNEVEIIINNHIADFFEGIKISEINNRLMRCWEDYLLGKGLSRARIKRIYYVLSGAMKVASELYDIPVNFVRLKSIGQPRSKRNYSIWTEEQFYRVMDVADDCEMRLCIELLYWSGIRKGELYGLKPEDLNPAKCSIRIERSRQRLKREDIVDTPKTPESIREISLPRQVFARLDSYVKSQDVFSNRGFIFRMYKAKLASAIKDYARKAGVPEIRVHDLRHSHAYYCINHHDNIVFIARRLGHANVKMTLDTYGHFQESDELKLVKTCEHSVSKYNAKKRKERYGKRRNKRRKKKKYGVQEREL